MSRVKVVTGAVVVWLTLIVVAASRDSNESTHLPATAPAATASPSASTPDRGLIYGRVTTDSDVVYEGRLRWGRDEEALWSNYFNGVKSKNPWAGRAPADQLPTERPSIEILGIEIAGWSRTIDLDRPFMVRFGDLTRIEPRGRRIRVSLKSGTVVELDRYAADDLADGVRVWDNRRGVVDLGERKIKSIEFLPTAALENPPAPLYGTVQTTRGDFTGLIQWDREACLLTDELHGYTGEGESTLRFDAIRTIQKQSSDASLVTLRNGREVKLSGTRQVGPGNRGIYVDDPRYGRVLVSWDAFVRVDFSPVEDVPAYGDFAPSSPLTGTVTTRSGDRFSGRLVYDLDESETIETLDAPSRGVDYTIPFGRIASIVPRLEDGSGNTASVMLRQGETLELERAGDLGERNAGMLILGERGEGPVYVNWGDVERVDLDPSTRH